MYTGERLRLWKLNATMKRENESGGSDHDEEWGARDEGWNRTWTRQKMQGEPTRSQWLHPGVVTALPLRWTQQNNNADHSRMPRTGRDHYIPIKADEESVDDEDDDDVGLIACSLLQRAHLTHQTSRLMCRKRATSHSSTAIRQQHCLMYGRGNRNDGNIHKK